MCNQAMIAQNQTGETATMIRLRHAAFALTALFAVHAAQAETINVVSSGGFSETYKVLGPRFEAATGNKLNSMWGPSMGKTVDAVPQRMARGEDIDVLIMVGYALDKLVAEGRVIADTRTPLAGAAIGLAVKQGAPVPDISTVDKLRSVMLNAKSIAYSDSASGVYIESEMLKKLGIEEQVKGKSKMIPAEPVAMGVARGESEVGFQTISELLPIPGVTVVGPVPDAVQKMTWFAAGVVKGSKHEAAARALIKYISSPEAQPVMLEKGMVPGAPKTN